MAAKPTSGINGKAIENGLEEELRRPGRWMLVDEKGTPVLIDRHHVLVQAALATYARTLVARWLVSRGVPLDEADTARLIEWKPNGWVPKRAFIVGAVASGITARELGGG